MRVETVMDENTRESSKYFYDAEGGLIGEKRSNRKEDFANTEVEYYYNPMKVYRITKYDKRGLQREVKAFYPSGTVKYEEYNNNQAYKKAYDEEGNTIGFLTYYSNSDYNTMPLDGDDIVFDEESLKLKSIESYKDGFLFKSQVFYPNGDKKNVFFNSNRKITKTEYYDEKLILTGVMNYDEEENPVDGIRFDFYNGRETKYENRKLIYDKKTDEDYNLIYEKIFDPSKKIFYVKVFYADGTLNFSYELPESLDDNTFTTEVTVYEKNKPVHQIKFLNGVIQNGTIILHYNHYKKIYERKGIWIFEYRYDENNILTDIIKAKKDTYSIIIGDVDFFNIGRQQTGKVNSVTLAPLK